jgi:hypothetical protein
MMKVAAWIFSGVVGLGLVAHDAMGQPVAASQQTAALQGQVSFQFERVGLAVPRYTIEIREDGKGRYQADESEAAPNQASSSSSAVRYVGGKHIDRAMTVSAATAAKIFKMARSLDYFNAACASKAKNIADTGKKTLSYIGTDGKGSCVYNYSENKSVSALTDMFIAMAFTMDEGRRLEFFHRYDRLGLDAEMTALAHEAQQGRAVELGTIAQTLDAIAGDMALMQRVRLRAARMLEQAREEK